MNRDCPVGAQCYLDAEGLGACQLDVDRSCGDTSCATDLTCLAGTCVRACSRPMQCPSDGECTLATGASIGVCSDLRGGMDAGSSVDAGVGVDAARPRIDGGAECVTSLTAAHIAVGEGLACVIRFDGTVVCWGGGDNGELGSVPVPTCGDVDAGAIHCATRPIVVPLQDMPSVPLGRAVSIGCGESFCCASLDDGHVRCWGRNFQGMLGAMNDGIHGAREVVHDDTQMPVSDALGVIVGETHACAIRPGSALSCWGANRLSELGRGSTSDGQLAADLTAFADIAPFSDAFVMSSDTCVVHTADDSVWCVGDNEHEQLAFMSPGTDPATQYSTTARRAQITLATPHVIAGGDDFACGVTTDGTVSCWGWNQDGSLGRGMSGGESFPAAMPVLGPDSGLSFTALFGVSTGHTMCGLSGGMLYCWGSNAGGLAGVDPINDPVEPTPVAGLPEVREASCGQQHCCAIDTTDHVWCWGANDLGQLGRGTPSAFDWHAGLVDCP